MLIIKRLSVNKLLATTVALIMAMETVGIPLAQASQTQAFWRQRQIQVAPLLTPAAPPASFTPSLPARALAGFDIPSTIGRIVETWSPSTIENRPQIIHIQDVHGAAGVQLNIAEILTHALAVNGREPLSVAVEGAWSHLDFSPYHVSAYDEWREMTARAFLMRDFIAGAHYFALLQRPRQVDLFGIERKDDYLRNLIARDASEKFRERMAMSLQFLRKRMDRAGRRLLPSSLAEFERNRHKYAQGLMDQDAYISYLLKVSPSKEQWPALNLYIQARKLEKEMGQSRVEADLEQLVRRILERADQKEMDDLLVKSLAFKSGRLSAAGYYRKVSETAQKNGLTVPSSIAQFKRYLEMSEAISVEGLMADIGKLELLAGETMMKNVQSHADIKTFMRFSRAVDDQEKLWKLELTPNTVAHAIKMSETVDWVEAEKFLFGLEKAFGLKVFPRVVDPRYAQSLRHVRDFYSLALRRDENFFKNLMENVKAKKGKHVPHIVLIAGGFHTPGITRQLRRHGFPYVVVQPALRHGAESNNKVRIEGALPNPWRLLKQTSSTVPPLMAPVTGPVVSVMKNAFQAVGAVGNGGAERIMPEGSVARSGDEVVVKLEGASDKKSVPVWRAIAVSVLMLTAGLSTGFFAIVLPTMMLGSVFFATNWFALAAAFAAATALILSAPSSRNMVKKIWNTHSPAVRRVGLTAGLTAGIFFFALVGSAMAGTGVIVEEAALNQIVANMVLLMVAVGIAYLLIRNIDDRRRLAQLERSVIYLANRAYDEAVIRNQASDARDFLFGGQEDFLGPPSRLIESSAKAGSGVEARGGLASNWDRNSEEPLFIPGEDTELDPEEAPDTVLEEDPADSPQTVAGEELSTGVDKELASLLEKTGLRLPDNYLREKNPRVEKVRLMLRLGLLEKMGVGQEAQRVYVHMSDGRWAGELASETASLEGRALRTFAAQNGLERIKGYPVDWHPLVAIIKERLLDPKHARNTLEALSWLYDQEKAKGPKGSEFWALTENIVVTSGKPLLAVLNGLYESDQSAGRREFSRLTRALFVEYPTLHVKFLKQRSRIKDQRIKELSAKLRGLKTAQKERRLLPGVPLASTDLVWRAVVAVVGTNLGASSLDVNPPVETDSGLQTTSIDVASSNEELSPVVPVAVDETSDMVVSEPVANEGRTRSLNQPEEVAVPIQVEPVVKAPPVSIEEHLPAPPVLAGPSPVSPVSRVLRWFVSFGFVRAVLFWGALTFVMIPFVGGVWTQVKPYLTDRLDPAAPEAALLENESGPPILNAVGPNDEPENSATPIQPEEREKDQDRESAVPAAHIAEDLQVNSLAVRPLPVYKTVPTLIATLRQEVIDSLENRFNAAQQIIGGVVGNITTELAEMSRPKIEEAPQDESAAMQTEVARQNLFAREQSVIASRMAAPSIVGAYDPRVTSAQSREITLSAVIGKWEAHLHGMLDGELYRLPSPRDGKIFTPEKFEITFPDEDAFKDYVAKHGTGMLDSVNGEFGPLAWFNLILSMDEAGSAFDFDGWVRKNLGLNPDLSVLEKKGPQNYRYRILDKANNWEIFGQFIDQKTLYDWAKKQADHAKVIPDNCLTPFDKEHGFVHQLTADGRFWVVPVAQAVTFDAKTGAIEGFFEAPPYDPAKIIQEENVMALGLDRKEKFPHLSRTMQRLVGYNDQNAANEWTRFLDGVVAAVPLLREETLTETGGHRRIIVKKDGLTFAYVPLRELVDWRGVTELRRLDPAAENGLGPVVLFAPDMFSYAPLLKALERKDWSALLVNNHPNPEFFPFNTYYGIQTVVDPYRNALQGSAAARKNIDNGASKMRLQAQSEASSDLEMNLVKVLDNISKQQTQNHSDQRADFLNELNKIFHQGDRAELSNTNAGADIYSFQIEASSLWRLLHPHRGMVFTSSVETFGDFEPFQGRPGVGMLEPSWSQFIKWDDPELQRIDNQIAEAKDPKIKAQLEQMYVVRGWLLTIEGYATGELSKVESVISEDPKMAAVQFGIYQNKLANIQRLVEAVQKAKENGGVIGRKQVAGAYVEIAHLLGLKLQEIVGEIGPEEEVMEQLLIRYQRSQHDIPPDFSGSLTIVRGNVLNEKKDSLVMGVLRDEFMRQIRNYYTARYAREIQRKGEEHALFAKNNPDLPLKDLRKFHDKELESIRLTSIHQITKAKERLNAALNEVYPAFSKASREAGRALSDEAILAMLMEVREKADFDRTHKAPAQLTRLRQAIADGIERLADIVAKPEDREKITTLALQIDFAENHGFSSVVPRLPAYYRVKREQKQFLEELGHRIAVAGDPDVNLRHQYLTHVRNQTGKDPKGFPIAIISPYREVKAEYDRKLQQQSDISERQANFQKLHRTQNRGGAWFTNLVYWNMASLETLAVYLICRDLIDFALTAGLSPTASGLMWFAAPALFYFGHYLGNPDGVHSPDVRRLTVGKLAVSALGLAWNISGFSLGLGVILAAGISALTVWHAWIQWTTAPPLVTTAQSLRAHNRLLNHLSGVILGRPEADEESDLLSRTTTARFFAALRMTTVSVFQQPVNKHRPGSRIIGVLSTILASLVLSLLTIGGTGSSSQGFAAVNEPAASQDEAEGVASWPAATVPMDATMNNIRANLDAAVDGVIGRAIITPSAEGDYVSVNEDRGFLVIDISGSTLELPNRDAVEKYFEKKYDGNLWRAIDETNKLYEAMTRTEPDGTRFSPLNGFMAVSTSKGNPFFILNVKTGEILKRFPTLQDVSSWVHAISQGAVPVDEGMLEAIGSEIPYVRISKSLVVAKSAQVVTFNPDNGRLHRAYDELIGSPELSVRPFFKYNITEERVAQIRASANKNPLVEIVDNGNRIDVYILGRLQHVVAREDDGRYYSYLYAPVHRDKQVLGMRAVGGQDLGDVVIANPSTGGRSRRFADVRSAINILFTPEMAVNGYVIVRKAPPTDLGFIDPPGQPFARVELMGDPSAVAAMVDDMFAEASAQDEAFLEKSRFQAWVALRWLVDIEIRLQQKLAKALDEGDERGIENISGHLGLIHKAKSNVVVGASGVPILMVGQNGFQMAHEEYLKVDARIKELDRARFDRSLTSDESKEMTALLGVKDVLLKNIQLAKRHPLSPYFADSQPRLSVYEEVVNVHLPKYLESLEMQIRRISTQPGLSLEERAEKLNSLKQRYILTVEKRYWTTDDRASYVIYHGAAQADREYQVLKQQRGVQDDLDALPNDDMIIDALNTKRVGGGAWLTSRQYWERAYWETPFVFLVTAAALILGGGVATWLTAPALFWLGHAPKNHRAMVSQDVLLLTSGKAFIAALGVGLSINGVPLPVVIMLISPLISFLTLIHWKIQHESRPALVPVLTHKEGRPHVSEFEREPVVDPSHIEENHLIDAREVVSTLPQTVLPVEHETAQSLKSFLDSWLNAPMTNGHVTHVIQVQNIGDLNNIAMSIDMINNMRLNRDGEAWERARYVLAAEPALVDEVSKWLAKAGLPLKVKKTLHPEVMPIPADGDLGRYFIQKLNGRTLGESDLPDSKFHLMLGPDLVLRAKIDDLPRAWADSVKVSAVNDANAWALALISYYFETAEAKGLLKIIKGYGSALNFKAAVERLLSQMA